MLMVEESPTKKKWIPLLVGDNIVSCSLINHEQPILIVEESHMNM